MKIRLFLIFYFSNLFFTSAQTLENINVNVQRDYFLILKDDYVFKKQYNNTLLDSFYFKNSTPRTKTKIIIKKNAPHIVSVGSGMVWTIVNDTFVRIDNSYNHKMTNFSNVFVHRDTIFKFGGYGYWSSRNFFTYFSDITNEWELYPIDKKSKIPPGLFKSDSSYDMSRFYVSGGSYISPNSSKNVIKNNNIWRFDFDSKTWTDLGISNFFEYGTENYIEIGNNRHLVSDISLAESPFSAHILDFDNNLITPIDNTLNFPITKCFSIEDTIFNLNNNILKKQSLSSFKTLSNRSKPLYIDSSSLFNGLKTVAVIALVIMIAVLSFLYTKNKKRPKLSDSGFRFKRVHYPLSTKEHKILTLLIHNKTIDSKGLLTAIYDSDLSFAQNNRIKLEVIDSLNKKLFKVFDVENFVSSRKSSKDQRMLIYFSNYRKDFVL